MGVPTIAFVTPGSSRTGGRQLIKIWGGNFQGDPAPNVGGVTPVPNPSVEVLFGTTPAIDVKVLANSLLHVITPPLPPGTYSVTVRNITQEGAVIAGETVTVQGFVFALPTVGNTTSAEQSNLTRLVAKVVTELRAQVLANVAIATHTDYDDTPDGANIAALASLPGLVLSGPFLRLDRFYGTNETRSVTASGATHEQRPARTVDVAFTLIVADNLVTRALDLVSECTAFFVRNTNLRLLRDPATAGEYVEFEMDIDRDGDFKAVGNANNSNVHVFSGSFLIRGFNIDDRDMSKRLLTDVTTLDLAGGIFSEAHDGSVRVLQIPPTE